MHQRVGGTGDVLLHPVSAANRLCERRFTNPQLAGQRYHQRCCARAAELLSPFLQLLLRQPELPAIGSRRNDMPMSRHPIVRAGPPTHLDYDAPFLLSPSARTTRRGGERPPRNRGPPLLPASGPRARRSTRGDPSCHTVLWIPRRAGSSPLPAPHSKRGRRRRA